MPKLGMKVMLLAFFSNGDILDRPDLQRQVVRRLKKVAPAAEKAGVVLGVESWLNARRPAISMPGGLAGRTGLLRRGQHAQTGLQHLSQIRQLGRERICEIHCKENSSLLGKGP